MLAFWPRRSPTSMLGHRRVMGNGQEELVYFLKIWLNWRLSYERDFNTLNFIFLTMSISKSDFVMDAELSFGVLITSLQNSCTLDFTLKVQSVSKLQRNEGSIAAFIHEYSCSLVYIIEDIVDHREKTKLIRIFLFEIILIVII